MAVEFRKTKATEVDQVMGILLDGKAALAELGIDQWQGANYPHVEVVQEDVRQGHSYVVEDGDRHLMATAMVSFDGEPDYDAIEGAWLTAGTSAHPAYAVMHRVAVGADSVRRGAARFMIESALRIAREGGAQSLRIDTHPGNRPMLSLIESCGFTRCGVIRIAHADGGTPERVAFEKMVGR